MPVGRFKYSSLPLRVQSPHLQVDSDSGPFVPLVVISSEQVGQVWVVVWGKYVI